MASHNHFPTVISSMISALFFTLHCIGCTAAAGTASKGDGKGQWQLLLDNTEVVAMHMALTHHNTVVIFDQTEAGPSGHQLRRRYNGTRCKTRDDLADSSCYAHSVEYDIAGNKLRPLRLTTDTWCSSGSFLSNGTLLQTGGHGTGAQGVRYFSPCGGNDDCDWSESAQSLANERWYASSLLLPDEDRVIVVGGRRVFTYEYIPKQYSNEGSFHFPFLRNTYERREGGNNLYPFLHICPNGRLFVFANRDSILFNYRENRVVKHFPRIPGDGSRNYPSSGSSVILPLDYTDSYEKAEVVVCGGAANGAFRAARNGRYLEGLSSCGRMVITGNRHKWNMEYMPGPRLLSDMLLLPTGDVLIINGAKCGTAGWNYARNASLEPYLYHPKKPLGKRFSVLKATRIPRVHHSSAVLLPDGRVLVAGSNPHNRYIFEDVAYPTELRLQAFVPDYMGSKHHQFRPTNVTVHYGHTNVYGVRYSREFTVRFWLGTKPSSAVEFTAYAPPFTSHSISMNQRVLRLRCKSLVRDKNGWVVAVLEAPPSPSVAPAGYYLLTVVNGGIPSVSQWMRILQSSGGRS
ncbi:aldehyde oxidase GLOX-like [Argentina anserina]|uniref:aldehyde oxidase GLOX-like n=1 Tax=Argentina anserina TaxID=57926 RepID=UPI0021764DF1|nr:aldehyde oxidase GLOX-like [Potentilla anserina]